MPVGGDRAGLLRVNFKQQPVQIVPHVLLGHGKGGPIDQAAKLPLGQGDPFIELHFVDPGKILYGHAGQREAASAGVYLDLAVRRADFHFRFTRQSLADVQQFPGRHGRAAFLLKRRP